MFDDTIPRLTEAEKDKTVSDILDAGLPEGTVSLWRRYKIIPLSMLCFGIEDCLFLSILLACLCFVPVAAITRFIPISSLLFIVSPMLYALLHLLTWWKESMSKTLDWKQTCRLSFRTLTAMRMLYFGGGAILFNVPQCWLLWLYTERKFFLPWMMSVAVTSVFLYGALSLRFQRVSPICSQFAPPILWGGFGIILLIWENLAVYLLQVPTLVFIMLSAAALSAAIFEWNACLREAV